MYRFFFILIILAALATQLSAGLIQDKTALQWVKNRKQLLANHFQGSPLKTLRKKFPLINQEPIISNLVNKPNWAKDQGYGDEEFFDAAFQQAVNMGHYGLTSLRWSFEQLMAFLEYMSFEISFRQASRDYHLYGVRRNLFSVHHPLHHPYKPSPADKSRSDQVVLKTIEEKSIKAYNEQPLFMTSVNHPGYQYVYSSVLELLGNSQAIDQQWIANIQHLSTKIKDFNPFTPAFKHLTTFGSSAHLPLTCTVLMPEKAPVAGTTDHATDQRGNGARLTWLHTHPTFIEPAMEHIKGLFLNARNLKRLYVKEALARIHWWVVQTMPYYRGSDIIAEMLIKIMAMHHRIVFPEWKEGRAPLPEILSAIDENTFVTNYFEWLTDPDTATDTTPAGPDIIPSPIYQQALSDFLEENNLIIQPTPADGDCFLHAIAAQTGETRNRVRRRLIRRIKRLIGEWQDYGYPLNTPSIEELTIQADENHENLQLPLTLLELYSLLEQLENHSWIDISMVHIVAQEYQLPLQLTHPSWHNGHTLQTGFVNTNGIGFTSPGLNLIFTNGDHWTWALPGDENQADNTHLNLTTQTMPPDSENFWLPPVTVMGGIRHLPPSQSDK